MSVPNSTKYLIIGAGIHGLSTGYHLAKELKARSLGSGADITIIDKSGVAAGASGIACGVVRNNYYQPAMAELMAANVEVDRKSTRLNSSHIPLSRMPSSA